jgi:hypothetical protein
MKATVFAESAILYFIFPPCVLPEKKSGIYQINFKDFKNIYRKDKKKFGN